MRQFKIIELLLAMLLFAATGACLRHMILYGEDASIFVGAILGFCSLSVIGGFIGVLIGGRKQFLNWASYTIAAVLWIGLLFSLYAATFFGAV